MGSGGNGGGRDGGSVNQFEINRRPTPRPDLGLAKEKMREVGVKYTPTSTPGGGVRTEATIMKTGPSGELARKPGVSPGDVMATVGTLPTVSADVAAANIAGRTDVNVASLGDLARRARVGSDLTPVPTPGSVGLGSIGRATAMDVLTKLATDRSAEVVKDVRGGVAGVKTEGPVSGSTVYTGRPAPAPAPAPESVRLDAEPTPPPVAVQEEAPETIMAAATKRARSPRFKRAPGETVLTGTGVIYKS